MIPTHNTRTAIEWLRERIHIGAQHIIIAGATAPDIRDIIVEGESGILANSPKHERPDYQPSKARLTWPNGARAQLISAEEPDRFRGKQCDTYYCDELAAWPDGNEKDVNSPNLAWNQLLFGARLGSKYGVSPQGVIATTPKPTKLIRKIRGEKTTIVTIGNTYANKANLAPAFLKEIQDKYEGTRLGRQEIHAEILDEAEGALWSGEILDKYRVKVVPRLVRVVVAIDPAVSAKKSSDETGIIVAGLGCDGHGYVLADVSGRLSPNAWGRRAIDAYSLHKADRIIAEKNNGGDLVEQNLRTINARIPYKGINASRGKQTRAEPIAALSEQGRVHMVGVLADLEQQLVLWEPQSGAPSPDRLDAMVWALTELMMGSGEPYRNLGHIEAV
jgi:predicted phage terminase large subunit-like protein